MPFSKIENAKESNFPTTAENVPLTLAQINHLSRIYDAIKKEGSADNPMAVAWTQWKEIYKKEGDKWIRREGTSAVSEVLVDSPQITGDWIPIAKVGQPMQMANEDKHGATTEVFATAEGFELAVTLFNDINLRGYVNRNHSGVLKGLEMIEQKFEDPFLYAKFNPEAEAVIKDPKSNGRSIEASVFATNDKQEVTHLLVSGVSVLDGTHIPACTPQMGCASAPIKSGVDSTIDFDLATVNNAGQTIKIRNVDLYLEKDEKKSEEEIKNRLVAEVAYIGHQATCLFYEHDPELKIGDVISGDSKLLHTVQIAISAKGNVESEYHKGGDIRKMEEEEKGEAVTFTGAQMEERIATAVAEATEKRDNAHVVELTKLKDEGEAKAKEAEVEHEKIVKEAEGAAFKRAQARATFMQKFSLKDDSEVMKQYDGVKTVMDMQTLVNTMEIPMATPSVAGISSAKSEGELKVEQIEEIGSFDPIKGEWVPTYREEVKE